MTTRQQVEHSAALALVEQLKADYLDARVLSDGSVAALEDLLFTRAIVLGCDKDGWSRRFCFEDRILATKRFYLLQSEDDEPEGYTDRRPE